MEQSNSMPLLTLTRYVPRGESDQYIYILGWTWPIHLRMQAERVIREHDVSRPLFMFLAWQNNHPPLQVRRGGPYWWEEQGVGG